MRLVVSAVIVCGSVLSSVSQANAAPLGVNSGWQTITWACGNGSDSNALGWCDDPESNTTFEPLLLEFALGPAGGVLTFTDLYVSGDQFNLVINGVKTATTVAPNPGFRQLGQTYDWYFASLEFSTLQVFLPTGSHTLGFELLDLAPCLVVGSECGDPLNQPPFDWLVGTAAVRVDGDVPVPEPGSMLLLGSGLAGLAAAVRRRRRR